MQLTDCDRRRGGVRQGQQIDCDSRMGGQTDADAHLLMHCGVLRISDRLAQHDFTFLHGVM